MEIKLGKYFERLKSGICYHTRLFQTQFSVRFSIFDTLLF